MYYCHNCDNFFTDSEIEEATFGTGVYAPDGYEERYIDDVCPCCGSDELEEVNECPVCGDPCMPDEDFCDGCKAEMKVQLLDIVRDWAVIKNSDRDEVYNLIDNVLSEVIYG